MTLRLRVALLAALVVLITLGVVGVVLSLTASRVTEGVLRQTLEDEAERVAAHPRSYQQIAWRRSDAAFDPIATFIRTCLDGTVAGDGLPLSEAGLQAVRGGAGWTEEALVDGRELLVHSRPLLAEGRVAAVVQTARTLEEQEQALRQLQGATLLLAGGATLAGGAVCWLLAGLALRPLTRLGREVEQIGAAQDFERRVAPQRGAGEVGLLADAFNRMLAALHGAHQRAERALQAQRRFVADASHELRAPLTTLRGNLALLGRDPPLDGGERAEVLADLLGETERMTRLVRDLLQLAKSDGGLQLRRVPVALAPVVAEVCRRARLLGPGHTISYQSPVDAEATCDPDALQQILLILLDNAVKYTPLGGGIDLLVRSTGAQVAITVRDTGRGIDPVALPYIFERFYRGPGARSHEGAGLGLPIARALAEAQGGTLTVASTPGVGSAFTLTLPQ